MNQTTINAAPILEEDGRASDSMEAMIPMNLDPTFAQQLISLFGAPDLKRNGTNVNQSANPVSFNIPWSLAEQIYMHWCSSLISEDDSTHDLHLNDEDPDLRHIMDIELAMQLVEQEVHFFLLNIKLVSLISFQMIGVVWFRSYLKHSTLNLSEIDLLG